MVFEGKGSERSHDAYIQCPNCKKSGFAFCTGREVTHGNPFTPAADTEVEIYYECDNCQHEWSRYA